MAENDLEAMVCSQWTKTEFVSALALKLRSKVISKNAFQSVNAEFALLFEAGPVWLNMLDEDFAHAARLCENSKSALRAPDALHLACALRADCDAFFTLDKVLARNAKACGMTLIAI